MDFFIDNLAIISTRWPEVAQKLTQCHFDLSQIELVSDQELSLVFDKIQVASSYNQGEEARLQISVLPTNTAKVTLYGTGLGSVQNILLEDTHLKLLHVVVFNLPLFKASLTYFDHKKWLLDSRVNLTLPQTNSKIESPFIALPAELELSTNSSAHIRDRLCLALDNDYIEQSRGIQNAALQNDIMDNVEFIVNDRDVKELFLSGNKTDYIICAAGPTLVEHLDWLKQPSTKEKFTIIAVDTAIKSMAKAGIIPDIIVSIDPDEKIFFEDIYIEFFKNTPLVYFPVVKKSLLSAWKGPKYTAYSMSQLYNTVNELYPKGRLYCCGCVIHPSIDLSVKMGAKKVLLLGADFSFPDNKIHTYCKNDPEEITAHQTAEQTKHWLLNGINERVPTLLCYRGYLRDLEDYIELIKGVDFYNGSSKGALIRGTTLWTKF
ncbi:MAG: 6-hydroxymethylpterin diphosphokinase MptE-like protein [Colwellia sp.]